ncbi:conserved hypothetical protein [Aspergillus terreus NIH2624]|uniref:Uncharacterized protein n=1 Tax=Aspergillus terreus (strain NIH 2624 / FGSC A1156) TaxID=341663 RepID=Q0D016_ASPTN|nr:uncharacterized protein ATEG_00718 [Aspergillus terreus NIH2624]EAU39364.1 conserved hypothetical protein [Aspergillus terreus NIH2624]
MAARAQNRAARDRELGVPVGNGGAVVGVHKRRADKAAEELGEQLAGEFLPLARRRTHQRHADRHGWVDGRAGIAEEAGQRDGGGPGDVDGQPGAVLVVGEEGLRDHAVADDD